MFDSNEAIAVYRGWHALEQRLPDEVEIIDFDLVPDRAAVASFDSRQQVLDRLRRLRDSVEVRDDITEFIRAKLNASCYYVRCLQGEHFEFYHQVRHMLGKTPELVANEDVAAQRAKVFTQLEGFGVPIIDGRPAPDAFSAFDDTLLLSKDRAEQEARAATATLLPVALEILGFTDLDVPHRIELVDVDAYWSAWTSGTIGDLLLRFNFHSDKRWRAGDMEYLSIHEVCGHFVHAAAMAREIREGRLDPFIGITTVHDPHGFMGEGIADALTYFFPDDVPLSPHAILSREQRNWRDYQFNNAHILVNMGEDVSKLRAELAENPFTPEIVIEKNLDRWRSHPLYRTYQYSYGIALKYHQYFARHMSREQKVQYLRYAFTRYVTPRQLIAYAERLIGDR